MKKNWLKNGKSILYMHDTESLAVIIKISREEQLNALNKEVILSLSEVLTNIEEDKKIRSVIITGEGSKAFIAGADIKEFQNFKEKEATDLSKSGKNRLFNKISNFKKPVISAINGYALGGGLELALSSQIRLASTNAKMGLPECTLGLIPGYGGTQNLAKIIGVGRAMEMILTGKMISSEEAHRIGLVNYVVEPENLIDKCLELAKSFKNTSPESLDSAIKSINACFMNTGDNLETTEFGKLFETENFTEGVSAFLEKRRPNFNK